MSKRSSEDEVCSFFLERKKRHCRMKKADGLNFCPHHSHLGSDSNSVKGARVPCPYDSSHFCYESKLEKHLKKCNAREKEKPDYYVENVNIDVSSKFENLKLSLQDISDEELLLLIQKVKKICTELQQDIAEISHLHPVLKSEMENSDDKLNSFKHMKQQAALLSVMQENDFLEQGTCFVEFGAGKGQLMYWIIKCAPESEKRSFVLVDKSAQRHKIDNKFKDSDLQIQRLRIDIQHLFLGKIKSIEDMLSNVVGVSKHLCGGATDLALRSLTNTLSFERNGENVKHKIFGLLMALCCHHRCSWSSYVGRDFMEECGFTEREFRLMCCMASWATCGLRKNAPEENENENNTHPQVVPDENLLNRYQKLNLKHEEREQIGVSCKRLIDAGRLRFLEQKGHDAKLVTYTEKSVSLENVALLATRKVS